MKKIIGLILSLFTIGGCSNNMNYNQINQEEAMKMMEDSSIVILDVREVDEYEEGHIENAINIPLSVIKKEYEKLNKEDTILVYCRSGNRSRQASKILADLGYTHIFEFGGIMTWKGKIVK